MKTNLAILTVILSLTALWTIWSNTQKPNMPPMAVQKISDFSYKDLNGNNGVLFDHEGKVVFLHFWATWCAPCIVELPELIKLTKRNQDELIVLAISKDKNTDDIKHFLDKLDTPLPSNIKLIWDQDNKISEGIFGIYKLPETIIVKPNLTIQQKITGAEDNWNTQKWMDQISKLAQ